MPDNNALMITPGKQILTVSYLIISLFFLVPNQTQAQSTDPCQVTLDKKTKATYEEGVGYLRRTSYNSAIQQMRKVVEKEPACVEAWYALGLANFRKQEYNLKEAEKCFLKVVELCPSYDPYTFLYLGEIAYGREDYLKTAEYLELFLKEPEKIKSEDDYNRALELSDYSKFISGLLNEPVPFDPHPVAGISTEENEYLPILSPDNQYAFFTREKKLEPNRNSLVQEVRYKERFFFSEKDSMGDFGAGEEMPDPFNINDHEGGATLTADNKYLFYTVCKYDAVKKYLNCDIYTSENTGGEWQPIRSLNGNVNAPDTWESQPSVSSDGRRLYFVSDRPGGNGGYDIYLTVKGDNGAWSAPVNLGPVINSKGNEKSPFIHPDGKTLYYSSDGLKGLGGYDIFYTRKNDDGSWQKPKNIGYPINTPDDEVGFFVSTDGTKGFFASKKYEGRGGWDLYGFDLYDGARPEKVLFIKGTVKSENSEEPMRARIELRNMVSKKISEIPLDTVTGDYVAVAPFNSDYIMTVKKTGHVYESHYISRSDSTFQLPTKVDVEMKPIEVNKSYKINDIHFPFNSFELEDESKAIVDQLVEFLKENANISIQVQGHTDNIGNDADNLKLSEQRAESVYKYLIESGIDPIRLTYKGFGESLPVAPNDTEAGRAQNRRTVFVITRR